MRYQAMIIPTQHIYTTYTYMNIHIQYTTFIYNIQKYKHTLNIHNIYIYIYIKIIIVNRIQDVLTPLLHDMRYQAKVIPSQHTYTICIDIGIH